MNNINDRSDEMMKIFKRNYNRESEMKTLIKRWETSSNGLISVREAIAALESMQAPLPEDVDLGLPKCFRNGIAESPFYSKEERKLALWVCDELGKIYADMLERLWRENASQKLAMQTGPESYEKDIAELQQRIEELEGDGPTSIKARAGE